MTDSVNDESLNERPSHPRKKDKAPEDAPSPSPDHQRDCLSFLYDPIDEEPYTEESRRIVKNETNRDMCHECYGKISNDFKLAAAKIKYGTGAKSKKNRDDDVPATSIASVHLLRDMQRILRKSYHQGRRDPFWNYEACVARYAVHISHTIHQSNDEQLRLGLKEGKKKNRIASVRALRDLQRSFRTSFNQRRDGQAG